MSLVFTPLAQADIDEIYDYTARNWGLDQAEAYTRALWSRCAELHSGARKGLSAEHVWAGYRRELCGSHVIFYRLAQASKTVIVRVLHQRQDPSLHL